MYLFQVTGVADQKSIANFCFQLINTEKEGRFFGSVRTRMYQGPLPRLAKL